MEVNYLKKNIEAMIGKLEEKIEELETVIEKARDALNKDLSHDELRRILENLDEYI